MRCTSTDAQAHVLAGSRVHTHVACTHTRTQTHTSHARTPTHEDSAAVQTHTETHVCTYIDTHDQRVHTRAHRTTRHKYAGLTSMYPHVCPHTRILTHTYTHIPQQRPTPSLAPASETLGQTRSPGAPYGAEDHVPHGRGRAPPHRCVYTLTSFWGLGRRCLPDLRAPVRPCPGARQIAD